MACPLTDRFSIARGNVEILIADWQALTSSSGKLFVRPLLID